MKLTILKRLKICFEVMFIRSGHGHTAQEKQLSVFQRGYEAGMKDERLLRGYYRGDAIIKNFYAPSILEILKEKTIEDKAN